MHDESQYAYKSERLGAIHQLRCRKEETIANIKKKERKQKKQNIIVVNQL